MFFLLPRFVAVKHFEPETHVNVDHACKGPSVDGKSGGKQLSRR